MNGREEWKGRMEGKDGREGWKGRMKGRMEGKDRREGWKGRMEGKEMDDNDCYQAMDGCGALVCYQRKWDDQGDANGFSICHRRILHISKVCVSPPKFG